MNPRIRVYLASEDRILRESLVSNLAKQPHLEMVGHEEPGDVALAAILNTAASVVLLDADGHSELAQAMVERAHAKQIPCRFLVLTTSMPQLDAVWFIRHGVSGLFLKNNSLATLVEAIESIAAEGKWLDQPFIRLVLSNIGSRSGGIPALTQREHATMRWLVEGCTNRQIAEHLGISEAAVKATLQRLFEKMGVRTRGHLIRLAVEQRKSDQ